MTLMQLDLFTDEEVMSDDEYRQHKAKIFTAKSIYNSSGLGNIIKKHLQNKNQTEAFLNFDQAFKSYGFGIPGSYRFVSYSGVGEISYFKEDGTEGCIKVKSKELFEILLKELLLEL